MPAIDAPSGQLPYPRQTKNSTIKRFGGRVYRVLILAGRSDRGVWSPTFLILPFVLVSGRRSLSPLLEPALFNELLQRRVVLVKIRVQEFF